ncbi:thioredoxin family protein [Polaribacter aestuariivivens]|uniref:Thioredoxin family protein n=1 Tax=Polaribacter aestuariivivens TaxID=2304626 RepID=A0A5S3N3F8_9FLAO|nr:thioredoxin family protein [Polaribacter aestuariivivens]TMM28984.1 thioredoxin family protein [Polaribacter aestuariivivens]
MKITKAILLLCVFALTAFTIKTDTEAGYKVGDKIEDFKLKNIDNKMMSLSDFGEVKGYIIIFTCNTCPYSVANEDRIIALDKKYKAAGFPVVAINPNDPNVVPDDSFEKMQVRAKEKGFTFPYLLDEGQKVYPKFGATKTPHVYIVTANDMKVQYIGAIDNSSRNPDAVSEKYAENAVDALLAGKKVEKTDTRAIGCTIKTK